MRTESPNGTVASPGRLLEMLTDRFGAFEAIAMASIKLARHVSEDELHPLIQPHVKRLVRDQPFPVEGAVSGKISMGVGGINSCVICRRWPG